MLKYTVTVHKRFKRKNGSKNILIGTIIGNAEEVEHNLRTNKKFGPFPETKELQFLEGNTITFETKNYIYELRLFSLTMQEITRAIFNSETDKF